MSSIDIPVLLNGMARRTRVSVTPAPLRFVLCAGETLRLPLTARRVPGSPVRRPRGRLVLRVLSGTAWITHEGKDFVLEAGAQRELECARRADGCAVVSSLGDGPLLVEARPA
jgi:hypothetical protein